MKVYWHAIVKNESSRIERCMRALIDHIDGAIVLDTGSTDNTIQLIQDFFGAAGKPCVVEQGTFQTWDQARNDALELARRSDLQWDWLLLVDADMELVVTNSAWRDEIKPEALAHEMVQKAGSVVYTNARLLSRKATGVYRGVTHEYLDVPVGGCLNGAHFVDHADGANRTGKSLRDAALLRGGLEKEPSNGRYWYYLGQSLRDAGEYKEAIPAFEAAIKYSTWDEERWNARVNLAHCYLDLGDRGGFYRELLDAFNERPSRAEALYDLARHFRERGQNHAALLFAEFGLTIPLPPDRLFVNAYPYSVGFKEEYAICGYYDEKRRPIAKQFNNELSLSTVGSAHTRLIARSNMIWFIDKLSDLCPGFKAERINFTPPENWVAMNPSLSQDGDISVRCVNYRITPWGSYEIRHLEDGSVNRENPIHTRNFVRVKGLWCEVMAPEYEKKFDLVVGAEDMRLFRRDGELWSLSNFRDTRESGACVQHLARLDHHNGPNLTMADWHPIEPKDFPATYSEKNWMPWVHKSGLRLVHRIGTVLDPQGKTIYQMDKSKSSVDVDRLSGGGCLADLGEGLWLAITHETQLLPNESYNRYYYHRFVLINDDGQPLLVSKPFVFHDKVIEFAAGFAVLGDNVWITYGRKDEEAWLCTIPLDEVKRMLTP